MEENARERPEKHCLPPLQPYPWLVYFHGKGKQNQTFCTVSDPTNTFSRSIPELGTTKIWLVQHGWCLLRSSNANVPQLLLWNPCTLQKIRLPALEHNDEIGDCVLSSSPSAPDQVCLVLLYSHETTLLIYCQLGDEQWTKVDYYEELKRILALEDGHLRRDSYLCNPVYCNGCLYAEACIYKESSFEKLLVVIEKLGPDGINIKSAVPLPTAPPYSSIFIRKLLEFKSKLFRIEMLHKQDLEIKEIVAIVVHRLDFSRMVWEKVESMKDAVFFLSHFDSSFTCSVINQEIEGGRMYFTLEQSNFMYIYNIEDKSLMVSRPFSNLPKKRSCPIWLMPDLRITDSQRTELEANKEEMRKAQIIRGKEISVAMHSKETGDTALLIADLAQLIAERLNVIDYLHFRATNRFFRSVAPPIQSRSASTMPRLELDDLSLSPLFVFFEKDSVLTFVHPKHGLKYKYSINLPEVFLAGCVLCYSRDGWLLMATNTLLSFFFNPFTKEVMPLAFGPRTDRNTQCIGFSHHPTSSECVVVEFDKIKEFPEMMAHVTRLGEEEWDRFEFEDSDFPLCRISPALHKGAFYYFGQKGNLGVLEVQEFGETVSWEVLDKPQAPCTGYYKSFLVECDGNLLSVFEGAFGKWVRVFKLNESTMTWTKVENLGNHMLFVSHTSSFSAVANIPGMENKIYFPRFCGQSIVFYSLETNEYHTFDSEDDVVDFHCAREQLLCGWIEPRWK